MGVFLAIFRLSGKIPCGKNRSKICFKEVANLSKQCLITLALMSSIPGLFWIWDCYETSFSGNLVFIESIWLSEEYFDGCIFSANFGPIFYKNVIKLVRYSLFLNNFFSQYISLDGCWEYFLLSQLPLLLFPNFSSCCLYILWFD